MARGVPRYFHCSSCYLHLTDRELAVRVPNFEGAARQVPAHGERAADAERALRESLGVLQDLEHACEFPVYHLFR